MTAPHAPEGTPTPRYPHPDHVEHIKFEGCDCVVLAPEDYEALHTESARRLELLQRCRPLVQDKTGNIIINNYNLLLRDIDAELARGTTL